MATTLAQQLKRLSVPQTQQLKRSAKFRVSFLYDPKEAADVERSTAYYLGVNGLEELILIDDEFKQYERSLFDESSQTFERSVQTVEVNEKLDKVISEFLFRLSPYVLLRPAHKALEWLVYRYHIYLYNADDLVRCFLPFHGTNVFVRAIQMINLRNKNSKWRWLENVQKSGVPLAKSAVVNYAERNFGFLKFICDIVEPIMQLGENEKAKRYQVVTSFYSSTIVSLIRQCKKDRRPEMLTVVLPYILSGLSSSILDIQCSSLIFISQLAVKNVMKSRLFETLVKSVVKMNKGDVSIEAIMCLVVLYQTQKYETIPQKCLIRFQSLSEFVETLCELVEDFYLTPFIRPILLGCIDLMREKNPLLKHKDLAKVKNIKDNSKSKDFLKLFKKIVRNLKLDGDVVRATITKSIEVHLDRCIDRKVTAQILCQFETKYPDIFDEVLEKFLERASESERNIIQKVLTTSINVGKQEHSTKSYGTSLYLNLNHPKPGRRKAALDKLLQRIRDHKEKNDQFVTEALQARLHDDFYQIPMAIFREFETIYHFIPNQTLFEAMKVVLDKHKLKIKSSEYAELLQLVLDAMCSKEFVSHMTDEELDRVIVYLIAYIFPTNMQSLKLACRLIKSHLFKTHKLFVGISDFSNKNLQQFFEGMVEFVGQKLINMDSKSRFQFIHLLIDQCNIRSKSILQLRFVIISLLKYLIPLHSKEESINLSSLLTDLCVQCLKLKRMLQCEPADESTSVLTFYLKTVNDNRLPVGHLTDSLSVVLQTIDIPDLLKDKAWWSTCADSIPLLNLMIDVFNLLTDQAICEKQTEQQKLFRSLLADFINITFKEAYLFVRFLNVLWTAHCQPAAESLLRISVIIQARSLSIAKNFFQTAKLKFLSEKNNPSIALLVVALVESPNPLRLLILDCLQEIHKRETVNKLKYKPLIAKLVKNREELEMDLEQLPFIVSKVCKHNESILDLLFDIIESNGASDFIKATLLQCLRHTDSMKSLSLVCGLAKGLISNDLLNESQGKIVELVLNRLSPDVVSSATKQDIILELIKSSLNSKHEFIHTKTSCRFAVLKLITKQFFNAFSKSNQQVLFDTIVEFKTSNEDPDLTDVTNKILKKIVSDSVHVITVFRNLLNSLPNIPLTIRPVKKRRRVESILQETGKQSESEVEKWKYVCCVLETIQKKKKINNLTDIIPLLFDLLKRCLEIEDQSAVELRKQLILTCIQHCCSKLPPDSTNERYVNIDLVVKCLRASKDKQTHNDALVSLSLMANMFPESVLHNVMAIFTFMGTNMLRQDDYYSFEIMARTTKAVVPAMLATRKTNAGQNNPVFLVQRIFVDAFPDMPVHRRRAIFSQLLDSLNPDEFLGTMLGLLLQLEVTYKQRESIGNDVKNLRNKDAHGEVIKFALALAASYSPFVQMKACVELFTCLAEMPIEKDDRLGKRMMKSAKFRDVIFDISVHSAKEFRHFQYNCVTFVASVVKSELFIEQISEMREAQPKEFEAACKVLLEQVLHFSNRVALSLANSPKTMLKFWETLLHRTYAVLDKVNALLPGSIFVSVVSSLMDSKLSIVRKKAMELLNSRLQFHPDALQESEVLSLTVLIDPLLRQVEDDNSDATRTNQQVALLSLKMLCRVFGSQQSDQFINIMEVVTRSFIQNIDHDLICGSAFLCLVEVCACLGAYAISSLDKFMPTVLEVLSAHSRLLSQELLLMSVISSVLRLVEILSHFLSPYLPSMIQQICIISSNDICDQKSAIYSKLVALRHKIATLVPTRVLLPAVTNCYEYLLLESNQSMSSLMSILAECIVTMDKETRASNTTTLQAFFLNTFDYRSLHPDEEATKMEESLFEPVLALVMKLSESSFRPLFYKIFSWASQTEAPKERSITFYHLADKIVDKLKSLFLLFAGHFIQNAAFLLDANNTSKGELMFDSEAKCCLLISFILQTLHKCFLYDKEGFVNKERFDTLLNPLVNQIENQVEENAYEERISKLLAPCIGQLAESTADEANWKTLNYQILLKTRHNSPKVRLGALQCVDELNRHLEKDYLSLLPETIPFLAELMEDESTEVEQKCQTVIAAMELTLGESLQKYF